MIKYFNYILFSFLISIFFIFNIGSKISTNIDSILPNSQNKELLKEFLSFENNKKIFVAVKGLTKNSLKELQEFEKEINKIEGIKKTFVTPSKQFNDYSLKYYFYLNELNDDKINTINVKDELNKLYYSILNSFITININKIDPFELTKKKDIELNIQNGKVVLDDYGYVSIYSLEKNINSLNQYEKIYDEIKKIETNNITTFSSIYYFVENSRYIKDDVNKIVLLAFFILIFLYLFILRNITLLINTLLTLGSASILATIILTSIYSELSVFVLVFGLSISTIAIDYMFHHYFHKKYETKPTFNKEVFLGFFTTFCAFLILGFCDFLLIEQITRFAMISLLISYLIFAFIYQRISFKQKEFNLIKQNKISIKRKYFFFFSILALLISFTKIDLDFDISSLDYDNKTLKEKETLFKEHFKKEHYLPILLKASSIDELVFYNETLKKIDPYSYSSLDKLISKSNFQKKYARLNDSNLNKLNEEIRKEMKNTTFKKASFLDAYKYPSTAPNYSLEQLIDFKVDIKKYKNGYISYVNVSKNKYNEILKQNYTYSLSLKELFEKNLEKDLNKIILLGFIALFFIVIMISITSKKNMLLALNFLLFPSALIFIYLSFVPVNILHIFMYFVILSISIDYAIYSSKDSSKQTNKAIIFSAISSFTGFGVLIFSNITSLYSIGSVATLGIVAILILIFFQKVDNASKSL